jgi:uncharacterized membrane protein
MADTNPNARLETFCDGVFAIALTLLIIDVKIPPTDRIDTTAEFWGALRHMWPTVFAFVLSFAVILITWVNHHAALRLVHRSSAPFIYANGFLLLTVVFVPFPTALLGEYLSTNHASPAVVLFNVVLAVQAIAWILVSRTAVAGRLTRHERATATMRVNGRFGYVACVGYALFALAAVWFPLTIAGLTTLVWIFWLALGVTMKQE